MRWSLIPLLMTLSLPTSAILLDCERQPNGQYLCEEVTGPADAADAAAAGTGKAPAAQTPIEQRYIDQAREHCEYREPRRRTGKASSASMVEDRKLAREAYERCLQSTAAELREADR